MKTLITGINGFIGTHLNEYLQSKDIEVKGISRHEGENIYKGDITDTVFVEKTLLEYKPDFMFHLAAQSNIPYSFEHPQETINANLTGTVNILEVLKKHTLAIRCIIAGTSAEYGSTKDTSYRFTEADSPAPTSPYAITKAAQGMFISNYNQAFGLKAVHVRPFAIIGPKKDKDAISDFCKGIIAIEQGKKKELAVGNLSHIRDFTDIRDAVKAFEIMVTSDHEFSVFNICSGKGTKLSDLLEILLSFSKAKITVIQDPAKMRPADDRVIIGNPDRLESLGYRTQYSLEDTLKATLEYWRTQL